MKIIINYMIALCLIGFVACEDVNSLHEKYLERGEEIYTGVIDSLKAYSGRERVQFTWEINSDPRITQVVIYWHDRADSSVVEVNRTVPGNMQMETLLKLPEGGYIFEFITKDDEGHKSLYVQKTVDIYGDKYIQMLRNRGVKSIKMKEGNQAVLTWLDIEDNTLQYVTISYTDYTDPQRPVTKTRRVENTDKETTLPNIKAGDKITVVSTYLPSAESLDEVNTVPQQYTLPESK